MKVVIITDLEGISCVDTIDMIFGDGYQFACEQLMLDVNAAINGAFDGGADEVFVVDGHGTGENFIHDALDKRAQFVPTPRFARMSLDEFDAVFSIGCHAKSGTVNAFLDHTQSSASWFDYTVGGKSYGEIGQQLIWAGAGSVPLVMVAGDEAACREAKDLVPNIATASVKNAVIRNKAECISGEVARQRIYEAAIDGVKRYKEIKPYRIELPTEITVTLYRNDYCDEVMARNPALKRNGRTLSKTVDSIKNLVDLIF